MSSTMGWRVRLGMVIDVDQRCGHRVSEYRSCGMPAPYRVDSSFRDLPTRTRWRCRLHAKVLATNLSLPFPPGLWKEEEP